LVSADVTQSAKHVTIDESLVAHIMHVSSLPCAHHAVAPRRSMSPAQRCSAVSAASLADAPDWVRDAVREQPWRGGLEPCGEYVDLEGAVISGALPPELSGTLYRNGPGRLRLGSSLKYSHWFDGDGQVTAIRLDGKDGRVVVSSKLVRTPRLEKQQGSSDEFRTRGAWTQATPWWRNLAALPTNPANTSIVRWNGKLLALCEGGPPMEIDPDTCDTVAAAPMGSPRLLGFGAHCKIDPEDGHLYNVGTQLPLLDLRVFKLDANGKEVAAATVNLGGEVAFVHDFALSSRHLAIFVVPYTAVSADTARAVVGLQSLGWSLQWRPERPVRCVVLRKSDLQTVFECSVPTFSSYHTANAFEVGDELHVQLAKLIGPRDQLEACFTDMYKAAFRREQYNELHTYRFNIAARTFLGSQPTMEASSGSLPMDFPAVHPRWMGRQARYVYSTAFSGRATFFDAIQKCDTVSGTATVRQCPQGEYPSEVTFVPRSSASGAFEDDGFILYLSYAAATHSSTLTVLDAARFDHDEPLCVVQLPWHVPHGFHGWWDSGSRPDGLSAKHH
jgi:all-trans-8'-apo-beta-carotenal 15,15'-oxygenase